LFVLQIFGLVAHDQVRCLGGVLGTQSDLPT